MSDNPLIGHGNNYYGNTDPLGRVGETPQGRKLVIGTPRTHPAEPIDEPDFLADPPTATPEQPVSRPDYRVEGRNDEQAHLPAPHDRGMADHRHAPHGAEQGAVGVRAHGLDGGDIPGALSRVSPSPSSVTATPEQGFTSDALNGMADKLQGGELTDTFVLIEMLRFAADHLDDKPMLLQPEVEGPLSPRNAADVLAWVKEGLENSIRIAQSKDGDDRDGWLEDVAFWREIVARLQPSPSPSPLSLADVPRYLMDPHNMGKLTPFVTVADIEALVQRLENRIEILELGMKANGDAFEAERVRAEQAEASLQRQRAYVQHKPGCAALGCSGHYDGTVCSLRT